MEIAMNVKQPAVAEEEFIFGCESNTTTNISSSTL